MAALKKSLDAGDGRQAQKPAAKKARGQESAGEESGRRRKRA